jgi:V8-like Glu-specific endopeptidase
MISEVAFMLKLMTAFCLIMLISAPASADDNSCEYARDNECDEGRYGGGAACEDGTDTADCASVAATGQCEYAFDYECDEARFEGTGSCDAGTDTFDCALLTTMVGDDSCPFASDNECDEPRFNGTGVCRDGSDTTDCQAATAAEQARFDSLPADIRALLGDNSCEYADDLECDDETFGGTEFCSAGTDANDCRALAAGGDDSCTYANDNECDEPSIGTEMCASGSDATDCKGLEFMRNRDNICNLAFDGICNEPDGGDGQCEANSDTADCVGRNRPAALYDHFFGSDDRFIPDTSEMPWRAIGYLDGEGGCTGTLVAPNLVLTAAHCVTEDGVTITLPDRFYAGQNLGRYEAEARVVSGEVAPGYDPEDADRGQGNGDDWAILTLDSNIGSKVGYLGVHVLGPAEIDQINSGGLVVSQAGYSWDTEPNLSGHRNCKIIQILDDNSIFHECDTTHGDSGSPIMLKIKGDWQIVAVDSQFFDAEEKSAFTSSSLAVDSRAFAAAVERALAAAGVPSKQD